MRYQPTVSRWFFRCLGAHLLRSPYILKAFQIVSARVFAPRGHTTPVERHFVPAPQFVWHCQTSSRRHYFNVHGHFTFRLRPLPQFQGNKKPCLLSVSRVGEKLLFDLQNLLTPGLSKFPSWACPISAVDSTRLNAQPGLYRL